MPSAGYSYHPLVLPVPSVADMIPPPPPPPGEGPLEGMLSQLTAVQNATENYTAVVAAF